MRTPIHVSLLLSLLCSPALADTVRLRDGQRIQGEVVQRTAKQVVVKTAYGVLVIPAEEVRRVDADRAVIVAKPLTESALNRLRLLHLRAKRLRALGSHAKAIELYAELLNLQPDDPEGLYWQGVSLAQLGQPQAALESLERAALAGYSDFETLRRSPLLAGLRGEPGFQSLLERRAELLGKAAAEAPQRIVSWLKLRGALAEYRLEPAPDLGLFFVYADSAAFALAREELAAWTRALRQQLFRAPAAAPIYVVLLAAEDRKVLWTKEAAAFDPVRNTIACAPLPGGKLSRSQPALRALVRALHAEDQASRGQRHPDWLDLGLAQLFGTARLDGERVVPLASGRLPALKQQAKRPLDWAQVVGFDEDALEERQPALDQARTLLHSLAARDGLGSFYESYGRLGEGASGVAPIESALGSTMAEAEATRVAWLEGQAAAPLPFAGLLTRDSSDGLVVTYVQPESGGAQADLSEGDVLVAADGARLRTRGDLDELLGARAVGDTLLVDVRRGQELYQAKVVLGARPDGPIGPQRGAAPFLGVAVEQQDGRVLVREVAPDSPAGKTGVAAGDKLRTLDGAAVTSVRQWLRALRAKQPGQKVALVLERGDRTLTLELELAAFGAKAEAKRP
ncbi:MAG: PDZ domain-containing protein [Planctomycetota bacterium]